MRILIVSMPVLALLSIFAVGASARVESEVDKGLSRTYLTPTLKRTVARANQQRLAGWDVLPS